MTLNKKYIFVVAVMAVGGFLSLHINYHKYDKYSNYENYNVSKVKHSEYTHPNSTSIIAENMRQFSEKITQIRSKLLQKQILLATPACRVSNQTLADAHNVRYFDVIQNSSSIHTIMYTESLQNLHHVLTPVYYDYASNDCKLLEAVSKYGKKYGRLLYGTNCTTNITSTIQGHPLQITALGVGLPDNLEYIKQGRHLVTYLHIIEDAVVSSSGDIIALRDNLKVVPQKCIRTLKRSCPRVSKVPVYDEVFTISQTWGGGFYHGTLENLPRIAPYLPFLLQHSQIKVHVASKHAYLDLMGLDKSRLVKNHRLRAKILYMPAGGTCGRSALFTSQMLTKALSAFNNSASSENLSDHSKDFFKKGLTNKSASMHDAMEAPNLQRAQLKVDKQMSELPARVLRDKIVLIKRSHGRWFDNHDAILEMIRTHAHKAGLRVEVFADNPLPSTAQTVDMFQRARIVVAPHGAGESNLILSQPGTVIIEGLCYDTDRKTNLCYRNMAQALGHRYYGIIVKAPQTCMNISAQQVEDPLLQYLNHLRT